MSKQQIIDYFLDWKYELSEDISSILYDDISKSLTFKQLQNIDHLRTKLNKVYEIIYFLDKEGED